MIALIPYQKFEIKIRLGPEAARQKLQEIVEPRKLMRFGLSRNHNLFEGEIEGNSFKISRIIHYRNSFLPILVGTIRDDFDTSTLEIKARFHLFVMIFWLFMGFSFVNLFFSPGELSFTWTTLPFLLFFYGLPILAFNLELNKAKKLLEEQFETRKSSLA